MGNLLTHLSILPTFLEDIENIWIFLFSFFFSFIMLTWVHRKITGTFFNLLCLVSNDFGCFWGVRYLSCLFLKFTVQLHKKLLIFQMSPNFKSVYLGEETSVSTLVFCFCRVYFFWAPHQLLAPQKSSSIFSLFATLKRSSGYFSNRIEIPLFIFYRKISWLIDLHDISTKDL